MAEERPRGVPHATPTAPPALDAMAQAFQDLLKDALSGFETVHGAVHDIPEVLVQPKDVVPICRVVKEDPRFDLSMLLCLTAVDYKEYIQAVYLLLSLERGLKLFIKANLTYEDPRVESVTSIWRGADWFEREAHDLFGVVFEGHGNLTPLVLYEGFEGYPGRKDFPFHDYQEF